MADPSPENALPPRNSVCNGPSPECGETLPRPVNADGFEIGFETNSHFTNCVYSATVKLTLTKRISVSTKKDFSIAEQYFCGV